MKIEHVAQVCHEANRALVQTTGDWSIRDWTDAEPDIKKDAVEAVRLILAGKTSTPEQLGPVLTEAIVKALHAAGMIEKEKKR